MKNVTFTTENRAKLNQKEKEMKKLRNSKRCPFGGKKLGVGMLSSTHPVADGELNIVGAR